MCSSDLDYQQKASDAAVSFFNNKADFEADTCPAFHIPLLRYAEYMFPLASIANKAPSVESPVFIKANLEYAGIEKESLIKIGAFPITPKQLPLDGKSVNEL